MADAWDDGSALEAYVGRWTRDVADSQELGRREIDRVFVSAGLGFNRFLGIRDVGWP